MAPRPARVALWLAFGAAAAATASVAIPASALTRSYNASTPLAGPTATLHWTLRPSTIDLALVITAADVVTANASALWMGFGIGDPASGSMLGADIVTAEFGEGAPGGGGGGGAACKLVDRHVPMVAYPLGSANGGDPVFPDADDCPNKQSWVLAACAVDPAAGTLTLEASRSLAAPDPAQDRDIVAGSNLLMYAYGDGFGYHGAARQTVEVDLAAPARGAPAVQTGDLASTDRVPADADGAVLLSMPNYSVSTNRTDYGCATFDLSPPPPGEVLQVVAAEAVIDLATAGGRLAHHLVLLSCTKTPLFDEFKAGRSCLDAMPACTQSVFGWAVGSQPLIMPDVAGFPITTDERFYLLQMHYDNPDGLEGIIDTSSVRLHTTTKPRRYESGAIGLGNLGVFIGDERVQSGVNYTYTCPSECTSQMAEPVTVFYSALHAHYTALQMWTNIYRNGTFFKTLEGVKHWSNDHQRPTLFEPTVLYPGDRLTVSAEFSVDKLVAAGRGAPAWGLGTPDEMLLTGLVVFPRPRRTGVHAAPGDTITSCGGFHVAATGEDWTVCGGRAAVANNDSASIEGVDWFNKSARAVPDEAGWSDPFNEAPTCLAQQRPTPVPKATGGDGGECFPAAATVRRRHGGVVSTVRMDDLRLGDEVLAAGGVYTRVYLWSHADAAAVTTFVRLVATRADGGLHTLLISAGHLLPAVVRGGSGDSGPTLTAAASLAVGDTLFAADGSPLVLTAVVPGVAAAGLYHPHTTAGNLVVDGVVASDLTTALPAALASAALAPLRAAGVAGWTAPARVASRLLRRGCAPVVRAVAAALWSVGA